MSLLANCPQHADLVMLMQLMTQAAGVQLPQSSTVQITRTMRDPISVNTHNPLRISLPRRPEQRGSASRQFLHQQVRSLLGASKRLRAHPGSSIFQSLSLFVSHHASSGACSPLQALAYQHTLDTVRRRCTAGGGGCSAHSASRNTASATGANAAAQQHQPA